MIGWQRYKSSVENYLRLTQRYDVRFNYDEGNILQGDGTPIILLGDVAPEGIRSETALVVISDVTKEEVEQLAIFVASLRQRVNESDK